MTTKTTTAIRRARRQLTGRMGLAGSWLLVGLLASCASSGSGSPTDGSSAADLSPTADLAPATEAGRNPDATADATDTPVAADAPAGTDVHATADTNPATDGPPADKGDTSDTRPASDVAPATVPTILSTAPVNGATAVPSNSNVSAVFSEAMDPTTLTPTTFRLTQSAGPAVVGSVLYSRGTAVFLPAAPLPANTSFTATITTAARSVPGVALAAARSWTFSTANMVAPGLPVDLGGAGNFVILAKSAISTVPASAVTGNLGISPAAATFITGFSLTADATNVFSTSSQLTGMAYAADYTPPTPSNLTVAVGNMQTAYTDAAGRAPTVTELGAGNIGGMTLPPGVYKWGSGLLIPTDITLAGSGTAVWILQVAQNLTLSGSVRVHLTGGALASNVFWQVAGLVDLGTAAHAEGVILAQTSITLHTGASINGRLLAQTAVSLDGSTVVAPAP